VAPLAAKQQTGAALQNRYITLIY